MFFKKINRCWVQCKISVYLTFVDAIAEDWVALPAAGLSVREEGGVEALPGIVQNTPTQVLEHLKSKNTRLKYQNKCLDVRISMEWMRSSLVVRESDSQCRNCNCPGYEPCILRHSGIWGATDEAVLNKVLKNFQNPKCVYIVQSADTRECFSYYLLLLSATL